MTGITPPDRPGTQAEHTVAMITALDELIRAVAESTMAARTLLATCPRCRNRLLYLLDTTPYSDQPATRLARRIAALGDNHACFHGTVQSDSDTRMPEIRGFR